MTIEAVIFDIDGVLVDSREANIVWYRDFLERHGYPGVPETRLAFGHSNTLRDSLAHMTRAPDAEVESLWQQAKSLEGYPYELLHLPEGCRDVLAELGRSYSLGIVSSRIREGIDQFLDFAALQTCFAAIVGYEDCVNSKPHPEPLLLACERLGVLPRAAVYVGDAATDLACARAAGASFVAYGDAVRGAEQRATCFAELPAAIERLAP